MRYKRGASMLIAVGLMALSHCETTDQARNDPNPRARRQAILEMTASGQAAADMLGGMLQDSDLVVRRTAARRLAELGRPAMPALAKAVQNDDLVVRRIAVAVVGRMGPESAPLLASALKDRDALVRVGAVEALAAIRPSSEEILKLLEAAAKDDAPDVQAAAADAVERFYDVAESIRLPADDWAFQLDPNDKGKEQGWFKPDFDDRAWKRIRTEIAWESQGFPYDGVAWYRRTIDLPRKEGVGKAALHFGAVDECAWLWVNGQYAGAHDLGPKGWDKTFSIDVTPLLRWGEKNQITVRVLDSTAAGGIWQPVEVQILKLRQ